MICALHVTSSPLLSNSLKGFLITLIFSSFSPLFSYSSKTFQLSWFMCHVHPFSLARQKLHECHDLCVHSSFLLAHRMFLKSLIVVTFTFFIFSLSKASQLLFFLVSCSFFHTLSKDFIVTFISSSSHHINLEDFDFHDFFLPQVVANFANDNNINNLQ